MDEKRETVIDRVATLTTEQDAEALREMARTIEELTAGVHALAERALLSLAQGDWRQCVQELEKLRAIE